MKRSSRRNRFLFVVLVASVLALGALLHRQGDLINPLQSTTLLLSLSSDDAGFALAGEERPEEAEEVNAPVTTRTDTGAADDSPATTGTLTLETLTAELAAAGVDVEAVSTSMSAEGRSLENLLSVVNRGRVSVAVLAARLTGETAEEAAAPAPETSSIALFDLHWEDFGSVLYDLWIILVMTVGVIVVGRPVGWLLKRLRRTPVTVS